MEKTKAIVLMIAVTLLVVAVASIAYASAQTNGATNSTSQIPQGTSGTSYPPQQGYYSYGGPAPYGYSNGYCYGRYGGCGC